MSVFEFDSYRQFISESVKKMPRRGHGQMAKLAQFINTSPVIVSQVMKGSRDFTPEQAHDVADYFGLNDMEKDYFLLLLQVNRAGSHKLKAFLNKKLDELKNKSKNLKNRIDPTNEINPEATAQFYSNWIYAAISLYVILPGEHTAESISEYFDYPLAKTRTCLEFMKTNGLIIEKNNHYYSSPKHTHVTKDSPYVIPHHCNWRNKAIEKLHKEDDDELFFTFPMAISKGDKEKIYKMLITSIEKINKIAQTTKDEELACLNIDFFKY